MTWWIRGSCALFVLACVSFGLAVCCNAGWLPAVALEPLQVLAVVSSGLCGAVGLAVFVALDLRGRDRAALGVGAMAAVGALPALAVITHLLFPDD